jgi:hypothetical protein
MKFIISCLSFLAVITTSNAQLVIRPYGGMNISSINKSLLDDSKFKSNIGYQIGADLQIGNKFYVQPGVQFEMIRNIKEVNANDTVNSNFELQRSYLRIPLMIGYNFAGVESKYSFRIFTGPNAALKLSSKCKDGDGIVEGNDVNDNLKSLIIGWNAGIGADLFNAVFIDAGYMFGLSKIFKKMDGLNTGARNDLFYVNIGVRLRL